MAATFIGLHAFIYQLYMPDQSFMLPYKAEKRVY